MKREDDDQPLPVTSEVGSEGGSYADSKTQETTRARLPAGKDPPERTDNSIGKVARAVRPEPQGSTTAFTRASEVSHSIPPM